MRKLIRSRFLISTQLYAGIGGAVLLTVAASLVGWFSFDRVANAQTRISETAIPEIAAAFGVSRYSGTLAAAGPRVTAATTDERFAAVSVDINAAQLAFEDQLTELEETAGKDEQFRTIRALADALIDNIEAITQDKQQLLEISRRTDAMLTELTQLRGELDRTVVPGLDDQFFYTMTGYRSLGEGPTLRPRHFSEVELARYRYLSELQADGNIATQLLASASNLSDPAAVEPFQERFEAARGRIERSLAGLEGVSLRGDVSSIYQRLFELGLDPDSGFELLTQRLRLEQRQLGLLGRNRDIALQLVSEVDDVVAAAEARSQQASDSSAQAILIGKRLLLAISAGSIGGALLIAWLFVGRVILRRLQMLSGWMRRMAGGDLESSVEVGGRDEIADMAAALEVFRRHALEVQRLNLVEKLAEELQEKNGELEAVLEDLRRAQDQIVMREKLAALGELTAGVAHEIRNPLNFVKNFSEASEDLLTELQETLDEGMDHLEDDRRALVQDISGELVSNLERIRSHGERADRIVHDMLMMGRGSGGYELTDLNRLLDQNARLAFHSARALNPEFQLSIQEELDPNVGELLVIPQDLGRVFLNMVANACDATAERRMTVDSDLPYEPTLWLETRRGEESIEIHIKDNGNGIPTEAIERIFNPFFTTKPTDKGTGLGLAISNDIIRQHGGTIQVVSQPREFTEMTIRLPLEPAKVEDNDAGNREAAAAGPS